MPIRFEYNIQTGARTAITQVIYRNDAQEILVLDEGISPPDGFAEYDGPLPDETPTLAE
jgi:hypothetical protein